MWRRARRGLRLIRTQVSERGRHRELLDQAMASANCVVQHSHSQYNLDMNSKMSSPVLDRLVDPLSRCLTPESAKRLLELRADPELQALVDQLGEKCNEGTLTEVERREYETYVYAIDFIGILQAKARALLRRCADGR